MMVFRPVYRDRSHDGLKTLRVQLQHAVEDADLIVAKWLFSLTVELQERLELSLLVRVSFVLAKHIVEKLSYRPSDGRCNGTPK